VISLSAKEKQAISDLVASRREGYGLPGEFYSNETVYRAELESVWRSGWLFVGHTCEIPRPGDYFTFAIGDDSLIVIRGDDGEINALWNVCRHRGTQICDEPSGRAGRLVCPYHQWTYARDGSLMSCRGMQEDIDKDQLGLLRAPCRQLDGFVYVSLSDTPPDFDEAYRQVSPHVRPQGLERAKVAKVVDYDVAANWKIVWENNRECYHCNVNHPQYIKANFDHFNADEPSPQRYDRVPTHRSGWLVRSESHPAGRGLCQRNDDRRSGRTADGRLHRCRCRHDAGANPTEYVESCQLRSRGDDAAATGRIATNCDPRHLARA
jgi:phenylpropionate dioxygenase-like ring-hydroxylating dioxygenase large terminal subunit